MCLTGLDMCGRDQAVAMLPPAGRMLENVPRWIETAEPRPLAAIRLSEELGVMLHGRIVSLNVPEQGYRVSDSQ